MKVVYCYVLDRKDGGYIHAKEFAQAFKLNGNQIHVTDQAASYLGSSLGQLPIVSIVASKLLTLFAMCKLFLKVSYAAFLTKPDVIIFRHAPNAATVPAQIFIGLFFPVVLEVNAVNEIEYAIAPKKWRVAIDRIAIAKANAIFVVSNPVKQFLVDLNYCVEHKITVIENGVDEKKFKFKEEVANQLRRELKISDNTTIFGFVGSMKKWHGIENIIHLAKYGESLLGDHLFLLVGDGELRIEYERQVKDFELHDTVRFIGRVEHADIPSYLSIMDVLLSPHSSAPVTDKLDFHGSPLKIFEYMAMAKAIIASPQGQIKSLIKDGVNGRLIDGENTQEILHELSKLQLDLKYREAMGASARRTVVQNYTWKKNALRVEKVCMKVV